jgi:cytochrome P450
VRAIGDYDFFSPAVRADPYPFFRRLRENDPVFRTDFGYWYVSTHADASQLVRDPRLGAGTGVPDSLGLSSGRLYDVMTDWMMALDGVDHSRVRRLVSRAFTPRAVDSFRPAIQSLADHLLDGVAALGSAEIVADYAFPIPMEVVRLLFGVDASEWDKQVVELVRPGRPAAANAVEMMDALADYLADVVARRRDAPGTDMFSAMVVPDDKGDRLSDHQLLANAVLLVTAGFETSMGLIALSILTLLRHPDQLAALRADPALIRNAVEEVLRFEPPALSTTRSTLEDVDVRGHVIPAGSNVLFPMAAVNRDPDRYPDPDTFDITRADIRPLTFGGGAHVCLGAALARLEAEVAVGSFFGRVGAARLGDDDIEWQAQNPTVRRPVALPVHLGGESP